MTITRGEVFDALRSVPEPCSIAMSEPQSIVGMGLIESIEIDERNVAICLVLTDASCVHFTALRRYITDVLLAREDVQGVEVTMSATQLWTPDRMNPTAAPVASEVPSRKLLPLV